MKEDKPKCFTEEEIKKMKELCKDAVRHTLSGEDFEGLKESEDQ